MLHIIIIFDFLNICCSLLINNRRLFLAIIAAHFAFLCKTFFVFAYHMTQTGHRVKWDHFDILATGKSDIHCKIKETLLIRDLKPAPNESVGGEKLLLY